MYPLGKTMQLKLNLFDTFDTYKLGKGTHLNQVALQTGKPRGSFKLGDTHPEFKDLFYRCWSHGREMWANKTALEKDKKKSNAYSKSGRGRAVKAKYKKTEKGLASEARYRRSTAGYTTAKHHCQRRREKIYKTVSNLTEKEVGEIKQVYKHCARVQKKLQIAFNVDHIIPLSKGGTHHPLNLQVVPAKWNRLKSNTSTEKWLPNGL